MTPSAGSLCRRVRQPPCWTKRVPGDRRLANDTLATAGVFLLLLSLGKPSISRRGRGRRGSLLSVSLGFSLGVCARALSTRETDAQFCSHFLGCEAEAVRTGSGPGSQERFWAHRWQCPLPPAPRLYHPALWTNTHVLASWTLGVRLLGPLSEVLDRESAGPGTACLWCWHIAR